jgi:hypothetical protein
MSMLILCTNHGYDETLFLKTDALVDTGCDVGVWVSTFVLKKLHLLQNIEKRDPSVPEMVDINGQLLESQGSITLT